MLKQPNLSARIGKVGVPGWCWRPCLCTTKPVSQDCGKALSGGAGSMLKQQTCQPGLGQSRWREVLPARIGVKSLFLGGAGAHFKSTQPNLSARIGVKSLFLGGAGAHFQSKQAKPVSQDWGNVVVGRCWHHVEAILADRFACLL